MSIYNWIIVASWAVFLLYWFVAAFTAKRNSTFAWKGIGICVLLLIIIISIFGWRSLDFATYHFAQAPAPVLAAFGALLTVLGVALAVWARTYLGRNWGMPMSVKENPELVTSGPYTYVRHPIYTGVLLAILGSTVAVPVWLIAFVAGAIYFIYSARQEEKLMLREFPDQYPAYKSRTKMLVPFIF